MTRIQFSAQPFRIRLPQGHLRSPLVSFKLIYKHPPLCYSLMSRNHREISHETCVRSFRRLSRPAGARSTTLLHAPPWGHSSSRPAINLEWAVTTDKPLLNWSIKYAASWLIRRGALLCLYWICNSSLYQYTSPVNNYLNIVWILLKILK